AALGIGQERITVEQAAVALRLARRATTARVLVDGHRAGAARAVVVVGVEHRRFSAAGGRRNVLRITLLQVVVGARQAVGTVIRIQAAAARTLRLVREAVAAVLQEADGGVVQEEGRAARRGTAAAGQRARAV